MACDRMVDIQSICRTFDEKQILSQRIVRKMIDLLTDDQRHTLHGQLRMARSAREAGGERSTCRVNGAFVLPEERVLRRIVIENEMFTGIVLNMIDMMILPQSNRIEESS